MSAHLTIRLADPSRLINGHVGSFFRGGRFLFMVNRDLQVDPDVLRELERKGGQAIPRLASLLQPGQTHLVRYFLERDIPGNEMTCLDIGPHQTDVYVHRSLMPYTLADELAAHSTLMAPHINH
ncbi:hypothetical protein [Streptosporangium vulgare]|uniref:Uncharacterized protein n=1 Tax=Streptosporangium vulgare TaxID=46190 RepID=A0ABV5TQM0_9ACTN